MPRNDTPPASPGLVLDDDFEDDEELVEINEEELEALFNHVPPNGDMEDSGASDLGDDDFIEYEENDIPMGGEGSHSHVTRDDAKFVFTKHGSSVFCCNIEPKEGKLAVTGGQDDHAYIWDTRTGNVLLDCQGHQDSVTFAEFSHDGTLVATADMSGIVQAWRTSQWDKVWEYSMGDLTWMKWHQESNVLMAGAASSEVYLWKVPSGDCKVFGGNGERSDSGIFLPDGRRACVAYGDGSVKILDLKSGTVSKTINTGEAGAASEMAAYHDNNLVLAGLNGKPMLLNTVNGKVISTLDTQIPGENVGSSIEAVCFSTDPALPVAAYGSLKGYLFVYDMSHQVCRHILRQEDGITKLLWDPQRPVIYTAGINGAIRAYDVRSGHLENVWQGHSADILDICRSPDGSFLVTASDDGTSRIFETANN